MVPDDLFRLQTIGAVAVSPAGDAVAYVVKRPSSTSLSFGRLYLWGNDRADVWVAATTGDDRPRNITNGETDGSGFWAPQWSPDGRWLAMLSTRGGNIRLWVWRRDAGTIDLLSAGGVDPRPDSFAWVSGNGIIFWTSPPNQQVPSLVIDHQTPEIAETEWAKAFAGKVSTASVLDSGTPVQTGSKSECLLQFAEPGTKKSKILSRTTAYGEFAFATIQVSPDHRSVAFLKQTGIMQPTSDVRTLEMLDAEYELTVVRLDGESESARMEGIRRPFWGSVRWAPDSTELAVIGYGQKPGPGEALFRCRVAAKLCRQVTTETFALRSQRKNAVTELPYFWFGRHALAVQGATRNLESEEPQEHWMITDEQGSLHDLLFQSGDIHQHLDRILGDPCSQGLVAASDHAIWKISPDGLVERKLTDLSSVTAMQQPPSPEGVCSVLALAGANAGRRRWYLLDSRSGMLEPIRAPVPDAKLVTVGARRTLVFSLDDDRGSYLWLGGGPVPAFKLLLCVNQFLAEIRPGALQRVEYSSLDGQELHGWVILPPDFKAGHRYPVVTWVYAGTVFGDTPPRSLVRINEEHSLNLQLLAAHGYVVLLPSMPLPASGLDADPYMELEKGVLPAIDKLVEMGIGDSRRLAVMGQSYGGYSAYGLITQTNRFQAAIVLAGISDLLSLYGTFDARTRYDSTGYLDSSLMWNVESMGMGAPPWTDLQRYIRNSPITYVSRVQTPLLIIQGDLDYIPIQQGEEFFSALCRRHRRAEFVRYWGEDHLLNSPANIGDMWQRIYAWLERYLPAS